MQNSNSREHLNPVQLDNRRQYRIIGGIIAKKRRQIGFASLHDQVEHLIRLVKHATTQASISNLLEDIPQNTAEQRLTAHTFMIKQH